MHGHEYLKLRSSLGSLSVLDYVTTSRLGIQISHARLYCDVVIIVKGSGEKSDIK